MATLTHAGIPATARPVRRPRTWPIDPADVKYLLLIVGAVVAGMWVVHGGLDQFSTLAGMLTGIGQLTALIGTYLALVGIVLMARVPWIDHVVGSDKLLIWHRWLGFGMISLILAHVAFTTTGWAMAAGSGVISEFLSLNETWDILIATVGTLISIGIVKLPFSAL